MDMVEKVAEAMASVAANDRDDLDAQLEADGGSISDYIWRTTPEWMPYARAAIEATHAALLEMDAIYGTAKTAEHVLGRLKIAATPEALDMLSPEKTGA